MDFKNILLQCNRVILLTAIAFILIIALFVANVGFGFHPFFSWAIFFLLVFPSLIWFAWSSPRFGPKKRIFISFVIFAYFLNAIVTGGIVIQREGGFGEHWEEVTVEDPISWTFYIEDVDIISVPLICWIYHNKKPPYAINIYIRDENKNTREISIDNVTVEYDGGSKSKRILSWHKKFEDWDTCTLLHGKLSDVIEEAKTCNNVEFEGYFIDSTGNRTPFKAGTKTKIEHSKPETRIYTLWSGFHD